MAGVIDLRLNPKQAEFYNVVMGAVRGDNPYTIIWYGGAIRGGKTSSSLAILIALLRMFPGSKAHIIRQTQPVLMSTTIPSFTKIAPADCIHGWRRSPSSDQICYIKPDPRYNLKNVYSELHFFSESFDTDKDLDRFKGLETNFILLEQVEELQKATYDKSLERVGSWYTSHCPQPPSFILSTFNPTNTWVKEEIYEKWRTGTLHAPHYFIHAMPNDNPAVTQAQWDKWKMMDPVSYARMVEGDWDAEDAEGRFAYAFDPRKHVTDENLFLEDQQIYLSVDFNVNPFCMTVWQTDRRSWVYLIDEIRLSSVNGANVDELVDEVHRRYGVRKYNLTGDATGRARSVLVSGNQTAYDMLQRRLTVPDSLFEVPTVNRAVQDTRIVLNTLLTHLPEFKISSKCKYTIEDLKACKTTAEGALDKRDKMRGHLLDTVRYFADTHFRHSIVRYIS